MMSFCTVNFVEQELFDLHEFILMIEQTLIVPVRFGLQL